MKQKTKLSFITCAVSALIIIQQSTGFASDTYLPESVLRDISGANRKGDAKAPTEGLISLAKELQALSSAPLTAGQVNRLQNELSDIKRKFSDRAIELEKLAGSSAAAKQGQIHLEQQVKDRLDGVEALLVEARHSLSNPSGNSIQQAKGKLVQLGEMLLAQTAAQEALFPAPYALSEAPKQLKPDSRVAALPSYMTAMKPVTRTRSNAKDSASLSTVSNSSIALPQEASACSYSENDLGGAGQSDAAVSSEIAQLAKDLEYSPAKIYEYVANEIRFEPYYGAVKGASGALISKAGNATDTASLLVALLRAAKIPARYVKGLVEFRNDSRFQDWIGAQAPIAAARILSAGNVPVAYQQNQDGSSFAAQFTHVWVEACVPYGNYRGRAKDNSVYQWIPLDASFKAVSYKKGISHSASFDYTNFLSSRHISTPLEQYERNVLDAVRSVTTNAAIADVPYAGQQISLKVDVLPSSLPYNVVSFTPWDTGTSAEAAVLPEKHRTKLVIGVRTESDQNLMDPLSLFLPDVSLKRITMTFEGKTATDQSRLASWRSSTSNPDASCATVINVVPHIKVDGEPRAAGGGTSVSWCTQKNRLEMSLQLAELAEVRVDKSSFVNNVLFKNIGAANQYALHAYAFQASDKHIANRTARLLASVKAYPKANDNPDELAGEFLNLAGLKYMKYISNDSKRLAALDFGSGWSGQHLGVTAVVNKVVYSFDLPYAITRDGLYIDFPGVQSRSISLKTGDLVAKTTKLIGLTTSYYESHIWQELNRTDAVSTVRALQRAAEKGIEVLIADSTTWADGKQKAKLTSNATASLNYSASDITQIEQYIGMGFRLTLPRSLVPYSADWTGVAYIAEKTSATGTQSAYVINKYSGGYSAGDPLSVYFSALTGTGYVTDPAVPSVLITDPNVWVSSGIGSLGATSLMVWGGDPVNMVTGNMYHTETDFNIKGRGGLPIVFTRDYNSSRPKDGPLGFGWTHSFNHYLNFHGVENNRVLVSWVDGSGAEKFYYSEGTSIAVGVGLVDSFGKSASPGFTRKTATTYELSTISGLTYTFEGNAGTTKGVKGKLLSISDRNGNSLVMGYTNGRLTSVKDGLNRQLTIAYNSQSRIDTVSDWAGRTIRYEYDTAGNLTSVKNPLAVLGKHAPITYSYYGVSDGERLNHAMKRFTLPKGNGMTFEYYVNGRVSRHCNDKAECMSFTYNDFRRESTTVNERGQTRKYFFDKYGNPTKIVDENGAYVTYSYSADHPNRRISERNKLGHLTTYGYSETGSPYTVDPRVKKITLPSGNTIEYSHHNWAKPGKVKDAKGNYVLYKYDTKGNLLEELVLKAGKGADLDPLTYVPVPADLVAWTIHTYDSYGNLQTSKNVRNFSTKAGPIVTFGYNDTKNNVVGLNVVSIKREGDKTGDGITDAADTVQLSYDNLGRMQTGVDASWYAKRYWYDALDRVTRIEERPLVAHGFGYDENGNLTSESWASVKEVSAGGQEPYTDEVLAQDLLIYDVADRNVLKMNRLQHAEKMAYDEVGNPIRVTNADGYELGFEYDPANHAVKAFDREGHFATTQVDAEGRPVLETDANGNTTKRDYFGSSKDGRLKRITDPKANTIEMDYDANGNVISIKDQNGKISYTQYDELNRPVRVVERNFNDTVLAQSVRPVTTYHYDTLGRLTEIKAGYTSSTGTDPSADVVVTQAVYQYDDFGRKLRDTDALGRYVTYDDYDIHGNPGRVIDAKGQITRMTWTYDHKLATVRDHLGNTTIYDYNALGQVKSVTGPNVTYTYGYNDANQLETVTDSRGNKTFTYRYSRAGLLRGVTDSEGRSTDYLYDNSGRLTEIWGPSGDHIAFAYDAGGRLVEKWLPNGVSARYTWDTDNTLKQVVNRNLTGALISQHDYGYDKLGNRTTHTETINGSTRKLKYVYDELSRLNEVRTNDSSNQLLEAYGYDAFGNRRSKTIAGQTTAYVFDSAHQLLEARQNSTSGTLLAGAVYDANGNLSDYCEGTAVSRSANSCSGSAVTTMQYDAQDRLTQVQKTGLATERYRYDHAGIRLSKTVGTATTQYLYERQNLHAEYGSSWAGAAAVYTYAGGIDTPVLRAAGNGSNKIFYHQDALGSVVAATDQNGAVTGANRYDSWGNVTPLTGSIPQYGYTGREPDATGLNYYRARYYHSGIGRFTQRDPAGFVDGVNRYAYVKNNPINAVDPMGLEATNAALVEANYGYHSAVCSIGSGVGCTDPEAPDAAVPSTASLMLTPGGPLDALVAAGLGGLWNAGRSLLGRFAGTADDVVVAAETQVLAQLPKELTVGRNADTGVYAYFGVRAQERVYVGITNNIPARQAAHGDRFLIQTIWASPFTRGEARAIEQALIVRYPAFLNIRNSISPKHPWYGEAVNWGEQWLRAHGI